MSTRTLEIYAGEIRKQEVGVNHAEPLQNNKGEGLHVKANEFETLSFKLDPKTAAQLRVFKQKLEKKNKKPMEWGEVMKYFMKECNKNVGARLIAPLRKKRKPNKVEAGLKPAPTKVSRYIPVSVRNEIEQRYKGICAYPKCNKPSEILHHTERFSIKPEHKSEKIAPLCKAHEQIAHQGLIKNEEHRPNKWKVLFNPDMSHNKYKVDMLVQKFRNPHTPCQT